ncbi:MAG: hypothetical protein IPL26_03675 [Leptospiraceae bacterium]|nr:hypothetical protein [Leptospiraceae bacterium]
MDHKIELEIIGEKAANYVRLFLIVIFLAGTIAGFLVKNHVSLILENYIGGIIIYIIATLTSVMILKSNSYTAKVKYIIMGLELFGFSFVLFGFLRLTEPEMLTIAINDIVLYAIYFLLIGESTLRFSPRFTLVTGTSCTLIFTVLGVLIKAEGGDKAVFAVTPLTVILGAVFIFAMTIVSYSGTKFVRNIVLRFKNSEEEAVKKSDDLKKLMEQTKFTIRELNIIIENIDQIIEESLRLSAEQLHYSESSIETVSHFTSSINSIASMAKVQEENCDENSKSISSLHEVTNKIDSVSLNIKEKGNKSLTLAEKGERELNQSNLEIQNISKASVDVSKIVTLINTIANQTNLLALNAAIEAARAGEEGKGFEVVANEVSKLAESSGRNAKQIAELIKGMKATVDNGEKQIQNSSSSMKEIMQMIFTISRDVQNINDIVHEQINIIDDSRIRTNKIQNMAQTMKELTSEEEKNSYQLKTDIEKVFSASSEVAKNIKDLHGSAEKLKNLSKKLKED